MGNKSKMKTKSSVRKRMKKNSNGTIKRGHAKTSHLFANKTKKQRRHLAKQTVVSKADSKRYTDSL